MTQTRRDPGQGTDPSTPALVLLSTIAGLVVLFWLALLAGEAFTGVASQANPALAVAEVIRGHREVPLTSWILFAVMLAALLWMVVALATKIKGRRRSDRAARSMGNTGRIAGISEKAAREAARRLTPSAGRRDAPGVFLGTAVGSGEPLYSDWETCLRILAGPRMGKTTSWATPAIMEAPGPVVATSNKGDVLKSTLGGLNKDGELVGRSARGRCWVFDPQRIASDGAATFWWNPLADVRDISDAREIAEFIIDGVEGVSQESAGSNAYFEGGAKEILAIYMLAAALRGGDLYHVKSWLNEDQNRTAVAILEAGHSYESARTLSAAQNLNPRQRDGLWDMARRLLRVLDNPGYGQWITPPRRRSLAVDDPAQAFAGTGHDLPEFEPDHFAGSTDTLFALSREGASSAAPLLTLLVGQVFRAAERRAEMSSLGRLDPPMLGVLDEAANICPLHRLPDWYSHFGSRGIVLMTFLQSPAQAQRVWGKDGFDALDSAAGVKIYAGAVTDTTFLSNLSQVIGSHWISTGSTTHAAHGGGSTQRSWQKDAILDEAKLAALPKDRAIIQSAQHSPVLAAKKPFWERPCADEVQQCLAVWDRAGQPSPETTPASTWTEFLEEGQHG
ncbi:type IV secretory system conjugative DNA transfer family protein [Dietzia cinnamea]|uniref:type IV secretory system conjugative DNA transfer family protein n=1 Tax=Dietzia cinnamea TaxID=321318 RepID=UPI0021A4F4DD|nr:TraM recognition domain-containing protein [Dietzia cinnamea]MCT1641325.1 TraM recognition domain-containing protein [Dietzia cinnamea]